VLRLVRLDVPGIYVFDEIYYAGDAASLLRAGAERGTPVHPPLGKWLIALGIQVAGMDPVGWRIGAAITGSLVCAVVAVIGWRLTRRTELALLAGALAALDGILFTASRVAMLDIFEALFVVLAVHACVVAVQAPPGAVRRWHLAAAMWLGLGAAVKWSALFTAPVLAAVIAVQLLRQPGSSQRARLAGTARRLGAVAGITTGSYVLAYVPTFIAQPGRANPADFLRRQRALLDYHLSLRPRNVYAHPAVDWLAQRHPAGLLLQDCPPSTAGGSSPVCPSGRGHDLTVAIVSVANPVVWALGILALAVLVGRLVYTRSVGALIIASAVLTRWGPWLLTRDGYSFYAASLVPFLVLAVVLALEPLPARALRWSACGVGVLAVAAFAFFYPYWSGVPMTPEDADLRRWMSTWP
jgi:dolichyl-phosphate-mannose-protein mannosyltransferase